MGRSCVLIYGKWFIYFSLLFFKAAWRTRMRENDKNKNKALSYNCLFLLLPEEQLAWANLHKFYLQIWYSGSLVLNQV